MKIINIAESVKENSYPGRGIIIGKSSDGKNAVVAYFIMGRSENSRNRVFLEENEGIRTEAFDPSKLVDPSLIIYYPVRKYENKLIVTNGDQTDTIYEFIKDDKTFEDALRTRTFEPDPPNYTPRISGILDFKDGDFSYKMSILKSDNGNADSTERFFYEYPQPLNGEARFIHTYICDGNPIPTFEGEPERTVIDSNIDDFANILWDNLNSENKVSLFVRYINLADNSYETRIFNKNK